MKKSDFTIKVAELILWIEKQGWYPLLDYALRSTEEQQRLFKEGKSKCDGVTNFSAHQYGKMPGRFAVDLYIHDGDKSIVKEDLYVKAHNYWTTLGGKPMLRWDQAHFEV